jgi:hypothetical protein
MLPFVMPSIDTLFASSKRVLAHYFYPFPLSIGNQPAATDYYETQYLTVGGESNKHAAYGGYLRQRPLPVTPGSATGFVLANRQAEVQMAIARGITGFSFDILSYADAISPTGNLASLLTAAQNVDPRFWVVPMLDMSSLTGLTQAQAAQIISTYADPVKYPNIARLPDGRILVSAFDATLQPLTWWQGVIQMLDAIDVDIAFIPVLLGGPASNPLAAVSHGLGGWGTATPAASSSAPPCMMMPVLTQQFRPKAACYWEAGNTGSFRAGWLAAINGGAQYVQIVTWSDFSESGQVQPYTDATLATNIGTGFYDLTAYYAAWFATGTAPQITKDVLYWTHRRMPSNAARGNIPGTTTPYDAFTCVAPGTPTDNIELLAFLTAPGNLVINGASVAAQAGITAFTQPLTPGFPQFRLQRDGSDVFEFKSPVQIYAGNAIPNGVLDMTYWSGSAASAG